MNVEYKTINKIMDNTNQKGDNQLHKNEVDKNTEHLSNEDIERIPASEDDYRLPRHLPESNETEDKSDMESAAEKDESDELIDDNTNVSAEEIALLEEADIDTESDEAIASNLLDETDDDGDALNESSGQDVFFDTGEDLDMTNEDWDDENGANE